MVQIIKLLHLLASDTVLSEIDFEGNSTETALVQSNNSATDKFIEMTNEVIKDVSEEASGDFLSIALQRFYSIIGSIETLNYLKGNVVDKRAITNNISNLLTDMIYTNYTTITKSWNDIPGKTTEDYATYEKEVNQYIDILTEAYNMCNDNIDALKRCVEIQNNLLLMKDEFKFSLGKQAKLEYSINSNLVTIHKVDPDFKVAGPNQPKVEKKKKKSFWSKIFN